MSNDNSVDSSTKEESKVGTMEDLTIEEKRTNTIDDLESEMSLEERMNWLRERVRLTWLIDSHFHCFTVSMGGGLTVFIMFFLQSYMCNTLGCSSRNGRRTETEASDGSDEASRRLTATTG